MIGLDNPQAFVLNHELFQVKFNPESFSLEAQHHHGGGEHLGHPGHSSDQRVPPQHRRHGSDREQLGVHFSAGGRGFPVLSLRLHRPQVRPQGDHKRALRWILTLKLSV